MCNLINTYIHTNIHALHIRKETKIVPKTRKKRHRQRNKKGTQRVVRGNCVWLPGRMHIEERFGRRAAASMETRRRKRNKKKRKRNARERQNGIAKEKQRNKSPEDASSLHLRLITSYSEQTSTSTLVLGYPLLGSPGRVWAYNRIP